MGAVLNNLFAEAFKIPDGPDKDTEVNSAINRALVATTDPAEQASIQNFQSCYADGSKTSAPPSVPVDKNTLIQNCYLRAHKIFTEYKTTDPVPPIAPKPPKTSETDEKFAPGVAVDLLRGEFSKLTGLKDEHEKNDTHLLTPDLREQVKVAFDEYYRETIAPRVPEGEKARVEAEYVDLRRFGFERDYIPRSLSDTAYGLSPWWFTRAGSLGLSRILNLVAGGNFPYVDRSMQIPNLPGFIDFHVTGTKGEPLTPEEKRHESIYDFLMDVVNTSSAALISQPLKPNVNKPAGGQPHTDLPDLFGILPNVPELPDGTFGWALGNTFRFLESVTIVANSLERIKNTRPEFFHNSADTVAQVVFEAFKMAYTSDLSDKFGKLNELNDRLAFGDGDQCTTDDATIIEAYRATYPESTKTDDEIRAEYCAGKPNGNNQAISSTTRAGMLRMETQYRIATYYGFVNQGLNVSQNTEDLWKVALGFVGQLLLDQFITFKPESLLTPRIKLDGLDWERLEEESILAALAFGTILAVHQAGGSEEEKSQLALDLSRSMGALLETTTFARAMSLQANENDRGEHYPNLSLTIPASVTDALVVVASQFFSAGIAAGRQARNIQESDSAAEIAIRLLSSAILVAANINTVTEYIHYNHAKYSPPPSNGNTALTFAPSVLSLGGWFLGFFTGHQSHTPGFGLGKGDSLLGYIGEGQNPITAGVNPLVIPGPATKAPATGVGLGITF